MPVRGSRTTLFAGSAVFVALTLALTGCQSSASGPAAIGTGTHHSTSSSTSGSVTTSDAVAPAAVITTNVASGSKSVKVDTPVSVKVAAGTFDDVAFHVHGTKQALPGRFNSAKTVWTASQLLEPGTSYVVESKAVNADGVMAHQRTKFSTEALTLDQQTYASITPVAHQTVGIGMPVIVQFDIPVHNKALFERHMHVVSKPATVGSWHWMSDQEVHWRPKKFWQPGTKVHVNLDVNGLPAGDGIYGQMSRHISFTIGDSVIIKPNLARDEMPVYINGKLARTIPITGGMPGFVTRSGIKLIIEKDYVTRMNSATVGIQPGDPNYYNIPDVYYAQRVTFSGEFLHAAPWSTYAQGSYNVSHGCVGMSTDNAHWLFDQTHIGDPVFVSGTDRSLEPGNGWTDWDMSWKQYKAGSALAHHKG